MSDQGKLLRNRFIGQATVCTEIENLFHAWGHDLPNLPWDLLF